MVNLTAHGWDFCLQPDSLVWTFSTKNLKSIVLDLDKNKGKPRYLVAFKNYGDLMKFNSPLLVS